MNERFPVHDACPVFAIVLGRPAYPVTIAGVFQTVELSSDASFFQTTLCVCSSHAECVCAFSPMVHSSKHDMMHVQGHVCHVLCRLLLTSTTDVLTQFEQ